MLRLARKDAAIIVAISALFFLIAAFNLGQITIPSTAWRVQEDYVTLTLDGNRTVSTVYLLVNTDKDITVSIATPSGSGWVAVNGFNKHGYYVWLNATINQTTDRVRFRFYLPADDILEIAVIDSSQQLVGIRSVKSDSGDSTISKLVDEQGLVEVPPTYRSETYFDEDLFVRAAKEYLNLKEPIAEETHPPLGKLIIAAGLDAFGFNPFSWRIMGVTFATLMIPVIYTFGLILFKTRAAATIAASLLALDFMHFTMSRMGTVDTYLVFFILLSTLFFYLSYEKMVGGSGPDYRFIMFGVACFGLAFSVKWIALFGLVGEAILFLGVWFISPLPSAGTPSRLGSLAKPIALITLLIVVVAGGIYLASFIPYALVGHSLLDIYNLQWSMFAYHSGMAAFTHPNESFWWQWPTFLVPLWIYLRQFPGYLSSSISAMGNPLVWWGGIVAIIVALTEGVHRKWPYLFLGVVYLSQLLPYALIQRYLFLYHYYAEVPILCLALAGFLHGAWYNPRQRKYLVITIAVGCALFVAFYPVISGYPIPQWYIEYLRWFRGWQF